MSGNRQFGAHWPPAGLRRGGFEFAEPESTEGPDDFECIVESTEGVEDLPSVKAERREIETLLDQRARLRAELAQVTARLEELGVEI